MECNALLQEIEDRVFDIRARIADAFLFEGLNLEINQDQEKLKVIINDFGFDSTLNESIDKISQKLQEAQDSFDFKGCIDLIRAFLNDLCALIALEIERKTGIIPSQPIEGNEKMGRAINYFQDRKINFLSSEEFDLLRSLNSFMSHKGVHVLKSDMEYARISRNMTIEKALFLVKRLEKYLSDKNIN